MGERGSGATTTVALSGFMGAGKTTTARRLGKLLGLPAIDVDVEIESRHGPIGELFARLGEKAFREIETQTIADSLQRGPVVLALGGGAVLKEDNRKAIRAGGVIVHLDVSPEGAFERVAHRRNRPMLGAVPTLERIKELMSERSAAYADNDLRVSVDGKTSMAIAQIIARWYRRRFGAGR